MTVSIHAPTRGATNSQELIVFTRWFQSTHPRGVRHKALTHQPRTLLVSIHAPTRGATTNCRTVHSCTRSFNPRTHAGCDFAALVKRVDGAVSIHAPTRGATSTLLRKSYNIMMFQSTHPRGVRPRLRNGRIYSTQFQSTHPRGVRPGTFVDIPVPNEFQSTHPRGVRLNR